MTITLIGQTASGKTTLGKALAEKLDKHAYKDLDHEVEQYMGMPIYEMHKKHTEEELKKYFKEVYTKLSNTPNTIIGTGGFFAVYFDFGDTQNIFYVNVSKEIFTERIQEARQNSHLKENKNRRIIHYKEISEVHEHYDSRVSAYEEKCTHRFDVNDEEDMKGLVGDVLVTMKEINSENTTDKSNPVNNPPRQ